MTLHHRLTAFNTASESENKIHDDAVASRFGFTGGLVPGVDVFAYMAHAPIALWGEAWLNGGGMQARFGKPVYDGDDVTVTGDADGADRLALTASGASSSFHAVPVEAGRRARPGRHREDARRRS